MIISINQDFIAVNTSATFFLSPVGFKEYRVLVMLKTMAENARVI